MPAPGQTPNLWTSAQVCDHLGIDRSTLSRWAKAGRITPAVKLPGLRGPRLFHPADVEALKEAAA